MVQGSALRFRVLHYGSGSKHLTTACATRRVLCGPHKTWKVLCGPHRTWKPLQTLQQALLAAKYAPCCLGNYGLEPEYRLECCCKMKYAAVACNKGAHELAGTERLTIRADCIQAAVSSQS